MLIGAKLMMMWKSAPDATKIDRTFHNGLNRIVVLFIFIHTDTDARTDVHAHTYAHKGKSVTGLCKLRRIF